MVLASQMHHVQVETQLIIYVRVTEEDSPITQLRLQTVLPITLNHTEQFQQLEKDRR